MLIELYKVLKHRLLGDKMKAMLVIVKCENCGKETAKLVPLEISEADWFKI